ncbi:MAG: phage protein Gp36 family protein [Planctomycetota bacterium]|jgi:hypothetical protein
MASDYCVQADMEKEYGTTNIDEWSDIDGDGDATKKANRITAMREVADEEIDDMLRLLGARIPAVTAAGTTPPTIKHLSAVLAGLWLYESSGAQDYNRNGSIRHGHAWRREWADDMLDRIATGKRRLDLVIGN